MSENEKELLHWQLELKRWQAHRDHSDDMCDEIGKRIDEYIAKIEAENVAV